MNFNQINNFLTVIDKKSISVAAESLFISPQALHQQINNMEQELGFQLIHRDRRGVTLTEAGQAFYNGAVRIAADYQQTVKNAKAIADADKNILTIYSNYCFSDIVYQQAVYTFIHSHPHIEVRIPTSTPESIQSADILLNDTVVPREFTERYTINYSQLYAVMASSHPLAEHKIITCEDLMQHAIVISSKELLEQLTPGFLSSISSHTAVGYAQSHDERYQAISHQSIFISVDKPMLIFPMQVCIPIKDTVFKVQLLTHKNPSPAAKAYLDYVIPFYQQHYDRSLEALYRQIQRNESCVFQQTL